MTHPKEPSLFLKKLSVWAAKINERSQRERALMLAVGIAFTFVVWNVLFHQAVHKKRQTFETESGTLQSQLTTLRTQTNMILSANVQAPSLPESQKKEKLKKQVQEVNVQFKKLADQILSASNVSAFLEKIIRGEGRLKIVELKSLPVESLLKTEHKEAYVPYAELVSVALYKHPVSLVLEGEYLDTLRFLENMQKLTWRVFWDELDYQVVKYPLARVTLKFHTLSEQKGRIGI